VRASDPCPFPPSFLAPEFWDEVRLGDSICKHTIPVRSESRGADAVQKNVDAEEVCCSEEYGVAGG
jgi:hypothetical protein